MRIGYWIVRNSKLTKLSLYWIIALSIRSNMRGRGFFGQVLLQKQIARWKVSEL